VRLSVTANTSAASFYYDLGFVDVAEATLYSRIAPRDRWPDHAGASVVDLRFDPPAEHTFTADALARTIT
jgi:hypothetical protein